MTLNYAIEGGKICLKFSYSTSMALYSICLHLSIPNSKMSICVCILIASHIFCFVHVCQFVCVDFVNSVTFGTLK